MIRVYHEGPLATGDTVMLAQAASHHLLHVLRVREGDVVTIFNGLGGEYVAQVQQCQRKQVSLTLSAFAEGVPESPLAIHLGQGISRGDRMDYSLQKAVELGVHAITPLITARCQVRLKADRLAAKMAHWQRVIISAAEQCGRCHLPLLHAPQALTAFLQQPIAGRGFIASVTATDTRCLDADKPTQVAALVGPESGFSAEEVQAANQVDYQSISLGPRTLRTETATVVMLSKMQLNWGDI